MQREVKERMQRFERVCREAGVKLTSQRRGIFHEVARSGEHPDAETVFNNVRNRLPSLSLDTVYRTLWMLSDLGLITTVGLARDRTRFDANLNPHHHFVCSKCGLTRDFYHDAFDDLSPPDTVKAYGQIEATHVEVRGVCRGCASKETNQPTTPKNKGTKK